MLNTQTMIIISVIVAVIVIFFIYKKEEKFIMSYSNLSTPGIKFNLQPGSNDDFNLNPEQLQSYLKNGVNINATCSNCPICPYYNGLSF